MSRKYLLVVMAGALNACNFAPHYEPPTVQVPAHYKETSDWQSAGPADGLPRDAWWTVFGDATLNGLEGQVDGGNPDLAAAAARYDQARALAAEAGAGLSPQLDISGALSNNRQSRDRPLRGNGQPDYYGANQLGVVASYEIDFWGKVRNRAAAGAALAQASAADLATMSLSIHAALASDYFTLRGLDADSQLFTDTVRAYQQALTLTRTLYFGKLVSQQDVFRAETQLEATEAARTDVASRRALLEHAIATLIGKAPGEIAITTSTVPVALPDIPPGVPSALLQRRPDVAAAERTVAAANSEIGIARAAFYPSISLDLLGGFQGTNLNLINLPDIFWSLGPEVTLPVFNGGALRAEAASAYAKFQEASAVYRSTVLAAFQDVEDNAALLHWLGQENEHEEAAVNAARHTRDIANILYQEGVDSYLDVVTAETALLESQQADIDIRTRRLLADVGMVRALGGGWNTSELPTSEVAVKLPPTARK
ncbi:efflux transporter outer membrane subunit [Caballeronia sp. LjRoot34]|uniref:efflux transporter outer membrane subunit n=1 Tax=Caballeronia sp. LjRoot34 TaxID=3342325 RepID=UPI003ED0BCA4